MHPGTLGRAPLKTAFFLSCLYRWDAEGFRRDGITLGVAVIFNPQDPSSAGPVLFPRCHDKCYIDRKVSLILSRLDPDIDTLQYTYLQKDFLQKVLNSALRVHLNWT